MANRPMPMFVPNFGPGAEMMGQQQLTPYVTTQDLPPDMPRRGDVYDMQGLLQFLTGGGGVGLGGAMMATPGWQMPGAAMAGGGGYLMANSFAPIDERAYMAKHFTDQTNRLPGYTPWDMLRQGGKY